MRERETERESESESERGVEGGEARGEPQCLLYPVRAQTPSSPTGQHSAPAHKRQQCGVTAMAGYHAHSNRERRGAERECEKGRERTKKDR